MQQLILALQLTHINVFNVRKITRLGTKFVWNLLNFDQKQRPVEILLQLFNELNDSELLNTVVAEYDTETNLKSSQWSFWRAKTEKNAYAHVFYDFNDVLYNKFLSYNRTNPYLDVIKQ